jgi:hypothetical protein
VKETNDAAVRVLASLLAVHLTFILKANTEASADATAVIAEESNTKLVIRRTLLSITGFFNGHLKTNLEVLIANPLMAVVGPLEGYVALALLMGFLTNTGKFGDIIAQNASIEVLTRTQAKPSFISDTI